MLAQLLARLGRTAEAQSILDDLAPADFDALPFDQEWFFGLSLLADTSVVLGAADRAAVLYRLLLPWSAVNASDHPEGFRGAIARDLARLAVLTERWHDAEAHFEDALALNAKSLWQRLLFEAAAKSQFSATTTLVTAIPAGYAGFLRARGGREERAGELRAAAIAAYDALGLRPEAREL